EGPHHRRTRPRRRGGRAPGCRVRAGVREDQRVRALRRGTLPGCCRGDHGKGRVPREKPLCLPHTCPGPPHAPAHPLRRLPSPRCILRHEKGVWRVSHLPQRYRVLHPWDPAWRRGYYHLHGRFDHGRERDRTFRRVPGRGLHDRRLHLPAYRYPGADECGLQWREHDRGYPRQPDHRDDRPPAQPEYRGNCNRRGNSPVSIDAVCRSCGVTFVETVDPYDLTGMLRVLEAAKTMKGVKVIIAKQMCVIVARRAGVKRGHYAVNPETCTGCGTCVRFGCPAIELVDKKARINELCSGCMVCTRLCPVGAISREAKK